jgi:ATP-binding cassette subfamily B protein
VATSAIVFVQGILPLLMLFLLKLVIDSVSDSIVSESSSTDFRRIAILIVLMGLVAAIEASLRIISSVVSQTHGHLVTDYMQRILHRKSTEVDLEYYENPAYFDTLHRAQVDSASRPTRILHELIRVTRSGLSLVAVGGLILTFHWIVALLLIAAVLPGVLIRLRYSKLLYRWQRERTSMQRKIRYFDWLLTTPYSAMEVRLFRLGGFFSTRFSALRRKLLRERLRITSRRASWEGAMQVGGNVAMFGSFAFVAYRAVLGTLTIGDVAMFYHAFQRGQAFLREVLNGLAGLYEDSLFLESLDEFMEMKPRIVAPLSPKPVPCPIRSGIVFDNVCFRYPAGTRHILQDVCLTLRRGEMVALVGENGSGKTTLVKLLCRLYDPNEGRITLDGLDVREYDPIELRRAISVVFQDFGRYHLKVSENIWLGDVERPSDSQSIEAAAQRSGADDFIRELRDGYDTSLGRFIDEGEEISIGQWQKIALARAYFRDAQLLVLDEPTSALDPKSEYEVFCQLKELTKDRSAIVISHRFSTVRMADRIYVLDQGRVVEEGSHVSLMELSGLYAHLFEVQARHYR